ncbi:MAG TPA: TonB C-terminal domain-containing protein [Verrucomicrobiae bacterium]|nr:TonB C-terminal domain-containing protein [Verrucomicrobiae bacterium]
MADRRKEKRASRLSVAISVVFHAVLIGGLAFIAAREGILGKDLKKIAVTMVPKEKPPEEKPKEKEPEPKPKIEEPKVEEPKPIDTVPQIAKPVDLPPPAVTTVAAPAAAPAAAALPAFDFEGGKAVETASDPHVIYKGYVEYTLRSRWNRPQNVDDEKFVAEVELNVDAEGRIQGTTWKKGSGHTAWDASVKQAIAATGNIGRLPPKGFPSQVLVRFDVLAVQEVGIE